MSDHEIALSRRAFIGGAAALGASAMFPSVAVAAADKPNSTFNGVQIGCITYSFRSLPGKSAEDLLGYITQCCISSVELMGGPAEGYARAYNKQHPGSDPMDGFKALRKLYNDAGVAIHIVKFGNKEQKQRYIPRVANEGATAANFSLSWVIPLGAFTTNSKPGFTFSTIFSKIAGNGSR